MKHAGQIVGYTRSGKAIFALLKGEVGKLPHPGNKNFSMDDYLDSYAVFEVLVLRAKRNFSVQSDEYKFYLVHLEAHLSQLELFGPLDEVRSKAGYEDAFDLAALGRELCRPEFKEV